MARHGLPPRFGRDRAVAGLKKGTTQGGLAMSLVTREHLAWALPYGLMRLRWRKREQRLRAARLQDEGAAALRKAAVLAQQPVTPMTFSYSDAIHYLRDLGCDEHQVREGSIPEESLARAAALIGAETTGRPLTGLHVGNFLGVSLAYLTEAMLRLDGQSVMISVDPNIAHRGLHFPCRYVISLLNRYGLQRSSVILTGYTLEKNISNDGWLLSGYDPVTNYGNEMSCERQLHLLCRVAAGRFDFCVIDGNHDPAYLRRELDLIDVLVKPGGLVILDDISEAWHDLQAVYESVDSGRYEKLAADGRIGVLRKQVSNGLSSPMAIGESG